MKEQAEDSMVIDDMPFNARLWVFQSERPLNADELDFIDSNMDLFTPSWAAHGNQLFAAHKLLHERFLIVILDENKAGASGCSIDKLMNLVAAFEQKLGLSLRDRMGVYYRQDEEIRKTDINSLKSLKASGEITGGTKVFNPLITRYEELFAAFEIPLEKSWHAKFTRE